MGKSQRMKANPHKPGDFWYKEGDGEEPNPTAEKPSIFMEGNPLVDQPSVRAMFGYIILTTIGMSLTISAMYRDNYLQSDSGAEAGLTRLYNEQFQFQPLEDKWYTGGQVMYATSGFAVIFGALGVLVMCCNCSDYNHRFVQFGTICAYLTALLNCTGCFTYEFLSRQDRHLKKYNTQIGKYFIARTWIWGPSYLCMLAATFIACIAAICAFCSTIEAIMCDTDPWGACKHCCCCSQKAHKVEPFVMPTLPSQGGHAAGYHDPEIAAARGVHLSPILNRPMTGPGAIRRGDILPPLGSPK